MILFITYCLIAGIATLIEIPYILHIRDSHLPPIKSITSTSEVAGMVTICDKDYHHHMARLIFLPNIHCVHIYDIENFNLEQVIDSVNPYKCV